MAEQYVVIYFPYSHLEAEAVGPFRSKERARQALDSLNVALSHDDYGLIPQLLKLGDVATAIQNFAPAPEVTKEAPRDEF